MGACTLSEVGVRLGMSVDVGVGDGVAVGVRVDVGLGVDVEVRVDVSVGEGEKVDVRVGVGLDVGVRVSVSLGPGVGVGVEMGGGDEVSEASGLVQTSRSTTLITILIPIAILKGNPRASCLPLNIRKCYLPC